MRPTTDPKVAGSPPNGLRGGAGRKVEGPNCAARNRGAVKGAGQ